jgi:hypothetical protein
MRNIKPECYECGYFTDKSTQFFRCNCGSCPAPNNLKSIKKGIMMKSAKEKMDGLISVDMISKDGICFSVKCIPSLAESTRTIMGQHDMETIKTYMNICLELGANND